MNDDLQTKKMQLRILQSATIDGEFVLLTTGKAVAKVPKVLLDSILQLDPVILQQEIAALENTV